MRHHVRKSRPSPAQPWQASRCSRLGFAPQAQNYKMTVNKERLLNAANEPQNWLMMNGDYGSHALFRSSPRSTATTSRTCGWSGRWRSAACRTSARTVPKAEVNPLIDNGFMYTSDGWGGDLQDRRAATRIRASSSGSTISGVRHEGNLLAHARHRAVGRPGDRQPARWPRDRAQPRLGRDRLGQEDRHRQRIRHQGTLQLRAHSPPRAKCWSQMASARGFARLAGSARCTHRQRAVALVRRAGAGRARQRDLEGQEQRLEDRRRRDVADRLVRSGDQAHDLGHRQPGSGLRSDGAPGRQSLHQLRRWRSTSTPASSSGISNIRRTTRGTTTRSASTCCTTSRSMARTRKVVTHFGRNGFYYSLDRNNGSFIKGSQYVNELNWTKGLDPKTGKPLEYNPAPRRAAVRSGGAAAARRRHEAHLSDLARRRRVSSRPPIIRSRTSPIRVGVEGCFTANGLTAAFKGPDGGLDREKFSTPQPIPATSTTARSPLTTPRPRRCWRRPSPTSKSAPARWSPPAASSSRRCRTAGSSPMTTRSSRSCGASTSARRSRARRSPTRSGRSSISPCRRADATCIR